MNANRNNNRRRGRGNNRGPGGNQGNRIDSRARGNAPQLLEKYKKLAHDASLNGDRVQTEYYLQFADHYFRVIAENKSQKDDPRSRRDNDRDQPDDDDLDDGDEFEIRGRQNQRYGRQDHRDDDRRDDDRGDDDTSGRDGGRDGGNDGDSDSDSDEDREDPNPFVRESRGRRPRTRARTDGEEVKPRRRKPAETENGSVDPGVLPPAINRDDETQEKRPARRPRRARPADDGGEETLEAVN